MEDYAWVIEYMPSGHSDALKREPAVQLVGERFFTLLEATISPTANIVLGQKVYVGKEGRSEISHIKGRLQFEQLTNSAKDFLPALLKKVIKEKEEYFVNFINKARPISIRVHTLDLIPGIGKKTMETLLKEREAKPFENFEDIHKRVPTLTDPVAVFVHRIMSEIEGKEKYYLFTKPLVTKRY